ncbi:MAG: hypothetical protein FD126_2517 [Elusimicrobia bacterium]|nr:MAG: hypothetical protein FD126_2517 [Elusimicrobiota bacterium]
MEATKSWRTAPWEAALEAGTTCSTTKTTPSGEEGQPAAGAQGAFLDADVGDAGGGFEGAHGVLFEDPGELALAQGIRAQDEVGALRCGALPRGVAHHETRAGGLLQEVVALGSHARQRVDQGAAEPLQRPFLGDAAGQGGERRLGGPGAAGQEGEEEDG